MAIDVLPGADEDLDRLESTDPQALAVILAVLEEAESDPLIAQVLTTCGNSYLGDWLINVKPWSLARYRGNNLFRFRVLETAATKYRVVYGYDWRSQRIGILAIVHKEKDDFDYGTERDIEDRIFTDWRAATGDRDT